MDESTRDNYPIHDEPTRHLGDLAGGDLSADAMSGGWTENDDSLLGVPERVGGYEIKGLLGSGGMGRVFLAEHVRMRRAVAIKMLPAKRMADAKAVERFYAEVRAASRLLHPNIVTAFDAGEYDGVHFLAMEYVDGKTLTEIVSEDGPLPLGEAAAVIRQASMGLLHAHRAGIVHRDVKPGNLMRASDGTIKVLDLGLARLGNLAADPPGDAVKASGPDAAGELQGADANKAGRLVGTLPFISPEQLEDPDSADARSDIYSLGATLCYLLTGHPPFSGEFLDQVYGHRHGEIPDLLQMREDIDLRFSHIFSRMMAKSPGERYASLDEVIEDLAEYAGNTTGPAWLADFAQRGIGGEISTFRSSSTHGRTSRVLGLDMGMFYLAAAEAGPGGEIRPLPAGGPDTPLFRMAVASDQGRLWFGGDAIALRGTRPHQVAHCVPIYLGQAEVQRQIAGRKCPPEVLLALMTRRVMKNAWPTEDRPDAVALTVPASYDQFRRRSILQAASMAGFGSVRLVDRCLAAAQARLAESQRPGGVVPDPGIEVESDETILFVGLTGQASEVAVIEQASSRLQQLATAGHWNHGTLGWLQRLVDMAAESFRERHGWDPRERLNSAARLQLACERAMNALLLLPSADIRIESKGREISVPIRRDAWLERCGDLIERLRTTIESACRQASIAPEKIDRCLLLGPLLRISELRRRVLASLSPEVPMETADRIDCARGAAACLAAELPGRGDRLMPPRSVTSQSIGIVVDNGKGRRRIMPIIPRGTLLPARTNRRLTIGPDRATMTLSLAESSGPGEDDWHSLGRHEFQLGDDRGSGGPAAAAGPATTRTRARNIGFEVDVNGVLTIRSQVPGAPGSVKLQGLAASTLSEQTLASWTRWLEDVSRD